MKAFDVTNIKDFMGGLLNGDLFNTWQFRGGDMVIECRVSFGSLADHTYLTDYEGDYLKWPDIQEKIRYLIKGKKAPTVLKLSLALLPQAVPDGNFPSVDAYGLNIQYENGTLTLISAVSDKSFSMDKEPGRLWDSYLPEYLKARGIELTEQ